MPVGVGDDEALWVGVWDRWTLRLTLGGKVPEAVAVCEALALVVCEGEWDLCLVEAAVLEGDGGLLGDTVCECECECERRLDCFAADGVELGEGAARDSEEVIFVRPERLAWLTGLGDETGLGVLGLWSGVADLVEWCGLLSGELGLGGLSPGRELGGEMDGIGSGDFNFDRPLALGGDASCSLAASRATEESLVWGT